MKYFLIKEVAQLGITLFHSYNLLKQRNFLKTKKNTWKFLLNQLYFVFCTGWPGKENRKHKKYEIFMLMKNAVFSILEPLYIKVNILLFLVYDTTSK